MNRHTFDKIIDQALLYDNTSLKYASFDYIKGFTILYDDKYIILEGEHASGVKEYHFACNSLDELLSKVGKEAYISFAPKNWVAPLKELGFSIYAQYNDYFSYDFSCSVMYEFLKVDDAQVVSDLTKACANQSRGFHGESIEWVKAWMNGTESALEQTRESAILVHREDDIIVGAVIVALYGYSTGPTLWIRELVVHPDHQNKGIGKILMASAMTYGLYRGARRAFLAVDELNKHAISLYKMFGFVAEGSPQVDMIRIKK